MMFRILLAVFLIASSHMASAQTNSLIPNSSRVIEGSHVFCTAACKLFSASLTTGASSGFLMIFDSPSDPPDGPLVNPAKGAKQASPKYCWPFPSATGQSYSWGSLGAPWGGAQFQTGMVIVFSTGSDCLHKTESATAFFTVQIE